MLPFFTATIWILVLLDSAHAHFVWLERDDDGPPCVLNGSTTSEKKTAACSTDSRCRGFFSA